MGKRLEDLDRNGDEILERQFSGQPAQRFPFNKFLGEVEMPLLLVDPAVVNPDDIRVRDFGEKGVFRLEGINVTIAGALGYHLEGDLLPSPHLIVRDKEVTHLPLRDLGTDFITIAQEMGHPISSPCLSSRPSLPPSLLPSPP